MKKDIYIYILFFHLNLVLDNEINRLPLIVQVCIYLNMIALKLAMVTLISLYNVQRIASH